MKKTDEPEVMILRSGYASRDLWLRAIEQAEQAGRRVRAVDEFVKNPAHRVSANDKE